MGRFISLPGVNPGSAYPKVNALHPLLPDAGALLLVEPGAPGSLAWPTGVPAQSSVMTNIAATQAKAIIPGSVDAGVSVTMQRGSFLVDSSQRGLIERTSKGGIHSIFRPTDETVTTGLSNLHSSIRLQFGANSLGSWLELHKNDHKFFFTQWWTDTYTPAGASPVYDTTLAINSFTAGTTNYMLMMRATSNVGWEEFNTPPGSPADGVPRYADAQTTTTPTGAPLQEGALFNFGVGGVINPYNGGGATYGKHRSRAYYLAYIEDLTVSGRTFAQVHAINAAAHASAFGAGGRYAGDTYTNPATFVGT